MKETFEDNWLKEELEREKKKSPEPNFDSPTKISEKAKETAIRFLPITQVDIVMAAFACAAFYAAFLTYQEFGFSTIFFVVCIPMILLLVAIVLYFTVFRKEYYK